MKMEVVKKNKVSVAVIYSEEHLITDVQSALDLIMSVKYETGCKNIAVNKETIVDDFFILSTCMAGEILQKFINYGVKFAIYGDFSQYTSKPLRDFMYESNRGKDIYFQPNVSLAVDKLSGNS
ncbi:DUF4180 domain-containing protein [Diplocloster agilis]|uniref:DUF4180 domain-containing protein n=1 Tax=Diplocloster agilis TaxID=2850323 RepID=A0A949NI92_9FIRM|nr:MULTISPECIES: DUF4180 domain-containing protein [Lachnospiraceae]MBU9739608.1 DUF4180 domain-containing protein [Diplocloster agilis]MBU9747140.1 DUF4180 domain-containing protein [Diplocloster agilis]MCU6736891.1 DUF4180 domain-containing protein [Suonthocola fibrivorans]SCJ94295.1 Uncharacterised protein [uncultured Clostridium sp.]